VTLGRRGLYRLKARCKAQSRLLQAQSTALGRGEHEHPAEGSIEDQKAAVALAVSPYATKATASRGQWIYAGGGVAELTRPRFSISTVPCGLFALQRCRRRQKSDRAHVIGGFSMCYRSLVRA
jgi:hypothetical protein